MLGIAPDQRDGLRALIENPHLRAGLNVCAGHITCEPVAAAHGLPYRSAESLLSEMRLAS